MTSATKAAIEETYRLEYGRVLAWLIGKLGGDFQLAEDCLSEALLIALEVWPTRGVPKKPAGWLATTARRKAIDRIRRQKVYREKQQLLVALQPTDGEEEEETMLVDERLRLIFTCCHPALAVPAQVALTLRTVAGLTTPEIARAFLVAETTMAQRLVRSKKKIKQAGIPYKIPPDHLLSERTNAVLAVIYLVFNEGYTASSGGSLIRADLCQEAIRLGWLVSRLIPNNSEVLGLLALMLCTDARRSARVDNDGDLVVLEKQNRTLWDQQLVQQGEQILQRAMSFGRPGPYQVQAAIAALHSSAITAEQTDWVQISALYDTMARMAGTPVIRLNRAVAHAMADGPALGLTMLAELEHELGDFRLWHAARADLLRRAGRMEKAASAYRKALELTENEREQRYLQRRLEECEAPS